VGGDVSASIYERGLCLPSGSRLADEDLDRITATIRTLAR
jgi:dTDP-4-amino-4,6-dideoxygalactose transaminase